MNELREAKIIKKHTTSKNIGKKPEITTLIFKDLSGNGGSLFFGESLVFRLLNLPVP
jgi:hypothetical protein